MGDTSENDSKETCQQSLRGAVVHVRIPDPQLLKWGSAPASMPATLDALKLFIRESSTAVFKLEIEKKS